MAYIAKIFEENPVAVQTGFDVLFLCITLSSDLFDENPETFKRKFEEIKNNAEEYVLVNQLEDTFYECVKNDRYFDHWCEQYSQNELKRYFNSQFRTDKIAKDIYSALAKRQCKEELRRAPTKSLKQQVIEKDNSTCQYCKRALQPKEIHIDHVVPYSLGGKTVLSNLVVSCRTCNEKKAARALEEFMLEFS